MQVCVVGRYVNVASWIFVSFRRYSKQASWLLFVACIDITTYVKLSIFTKTGGKNTNNPLLSHASDVISKVMQSLPS